LIVSKNINADILLEKTYINNIILFGNIL